MIYTNHKNAARTNCIVMADHGFRFFYMPKVACTGWKTLFRRMLGYENWRDLKIAHDRDSGESGLRYAEPSEVRELDLPAFAMVRHPVMRALSAYLDKICSRHDSALVWKLIRKDIIHWLGKPDDTSEAEGSISFTEFLNWLSDSSSPWVSNEHWLPQTSICEFEDSMEFIGRFERFDEDSERLLSAMGCKYPFPTPEDLGWLSKTQGSSHEEHLTAEALHLIFSIYRQDFDQLGYDVYEF